MIDKRPKSGSALTATLDDHHQSSRYYSEEEVWIEYINSLLLGRFFKLHNAPIITSPNIRVVAYNTRDTDSEQYALISHMIPWKNTQDHTLYINPEGLKSVVRQIFWVEAILGSSDLCHQIATLPNGSFHRIDTTGNLSNSNLKERLAELFFPIRHLDYYVTTAAYDRSRVSDLPKPLPSAYALINFSYTAAEMLTEIDRTLLTIQNPEFANLYNQLIRANPQAKKHIDKLARNFLARADELVELRAELIEALDTNPDLRLHEFVGRHCVKEPEMVENYNEKLTRAKPQIEDFREATIKQATTLLTRLDNSGNNSTTLSR